MYELLSDPKALSLWLFGIILTVMSWIMRREIKKLDELSSNAVRRDEVLRLHAENTARLDKISDGVERTQDRIDDIYRDLLNK